MTPSRRQFITNLIAFSAAAPAIVRATSLMPVKAIREPTKEELIALFKQRMEDVYRITREQMSLNLYGSTFHSIENGTYAVRGIDPFETWPFKEYSAKIVEHKDV